VIKVSDVDSMLRLAHAAAAAGDRDKLVSLIREPLVEMAPQQAGESLLTVRDLHRCADAARALARRLI
jgi:hypothetical protein